MQTITGKFIQALPLVEGDSSRGHWVRGGFILEYGDKYPTKVAFTLLGDERVKKTRDLQPGAAVQVNYQPESREYNGRWYTELQCFSVTPITQQAL